MSETEAFEKGMKALSQYINQPEAFPAVPINQFDPATEHHLHEEWECGYEYAFSLSKKTEQLSKKTEAFGPFKSLLNQDNKENPLT